MSEQRLTDVTKVSQQSREKNLKTLRTTIPLAKAEYAEIGDGDSVLWIELINNGKKGLFVRKVE
jgi:hypothetical protein